MPQPTIIRNAVSRTSCDTVATELRDANSIGRKGPYNKYEPTQTTIDLVQEADKANREHSSRLGTDVAPRSFLVATFRALQNASPDPPETPGNIYLAIALTKLNAETGILTFFPRDGNGMSAGQAEELEPGDGIVCYGEDVNPNGIGEGGVILLIRYQGPPGLQEKQH